MAEEIRASAPHRDQSSDDDLTDIGAAESELREMRAYARALRERADRMDAQLQQAEVLAANMRISAARKNGKQSTSPILLDRRTQVRRNDNQ